MSRNPCRSAALQALRGLWYAAAGPRCRVATSLTTPLSRCSLQCAGIAHMHVGGRQHASLLRWAKEAAHATSSAPAAPPGPHSQSPGTGALAHSAAGTSGQASPGTPPAATPWAATVPGVPAQRGARATNSLMRTATAPALHSTSGAHAELRDRNDSAPPTAASAHTAAAAAASAPPAGDQTPSMAAKVESVALALECWHSARLCATAAERALQDVDAGMRAALLPLLDQVAGGLLPFSLLPAVEHAEQQLDRIRAALER